MRLLGAGTQCTPLFIILITLSFVLLLTTVGLEACRHCGEGEDEQCPDDWNWDHELHRCVQQDTHRTIITHSMVCQQLCVSGADCANDAKDGGSARNETCLNGCCVWEK